MARKARRVSQRSSRKRISYLEPASSDEDVSESASDEDENEEFEQDDGGDDELAGPASPPARALRRTRDQRPRNTTTAKTTTSRSNTSTSTSNLGQRGRKRVRGRRRRHIVPSGIDVEPPEILSDGVVPDWASLPYHILTSILQYASFPLLGPGYQVEKSAPWLARALRTCKAFAEPGVTVLYECPPMLTLYSPHLLMDTLKSAAAGQTMFDYRRKVKTLRLNAPHMLKYSVPERGRFQLEQLLPLVPQLNEIDLVLDSDFPPYREINPPTLNLSLALFAVLKDSSIQLKGWRWNAFMTGLFNADTIKEIHASSTMRGLKRLHMSHIAFVWPFDGDKEARRALSRDLMEPLTELEEITLQSCSSEDWVNLSTYPKTLKRISFLNCEQLTSKHLSDFLSTHGRNLTSLVLNHNTALNLSFLSGLAAWCPQLVNLEMDLMYYSSLLVTRGDSQPEYDFLLGDKEKPTWPTTLQKIELVFLRKWSLEAARNFFTSLVDASRDLSDLRSLEIKVILDIGWRDRAGFRDYWISRLNSVFLRHSKAPNPRLGSKRIFRYWQNGTPASNSDQKRVLSLRTNLNASKTTPSLTSPPISSIHDTEPTIRKSRRLLQQEQSASEQTPRSASIASSRDLTMDKAEAKDFIQGACTHVEINIDNQRPREEMFHEADFMDSEVSGDEEWNGDVEAAGGYAW